MLSLACFPKLMFCQEKNQGTIFSTDTIPISNAKISNISLGDSTFSNKWGKYFIRLRDEDTIVLSHEKWEARVLVGSQLKDSIFLKQKYIQIAEVNVVGIRQKTTVHALKELELAQNKKRGIYYGGRPPIALLNPFGGKPITFFYELLSNGGRRARKMSRKIDNEGHREKVDQMFNASIIVSVVPLKEESLKEFIEKYRPTPAEVEGWTTYDMYIYIKKCFASYQD